jgi:hypothetical protein
MASLSIGGNLPASGGNMRTECRKFRFDFPTFGNSMKISETAVASSGAQVLGNRFRSKICAVTLAQRFQFHPLDQSGGSRIIRPSNGCSR